MYEIEFSLTAEKQLLKLDSKIQERIIFSLERIRIRPFSFVKKLTGSKYFRLRVGDYRVILDIHENRLIIFVIELGHRREIYKQS
jgi:mRNA interferase RelE/StbE